MAARYAAYLTDDVGNYITLLRGFSTLQYTKRVNSKGTFGITFAPQFFDKSQFSRDRRIVVWRQIDAAAAPTIDFVGFCRYFGWRQQNHKLTYSILGFDANTLLDRRRVAYKATTAQADKTDEADNMAKAYVRENLGALSTDTLRNLESYLSVAADVSAAPSVGPVTASFDNLLLTLQDIAELSDEAGTPLYFDISPNGRKLFKFETFIRQRGSDRASVTPVVLRADAGALIDPFFSQDHREELSVAYVLGSNTGVNRLVKEEKYQARIDKSVFNRIETTVEAGDIGDPAILAEKGQAVIRMHPPILTFDAKIKSAPGAIYGRNWFYGDRLKAAFNGGLYVVEARSVTVQLHDSGLEEVYAKLDVYE
ncbi:MAG: siphovirus ReqiPepy6 Gp37-like family protein [Phycisphaerales bacterium]|nr:siphovirus ReqiPepy6 Gp37-like family protein [Phycisphaerales bacterium]